MPKRIQIRGLTIVDLVDILDRNGYKNLAALEKVSPNPLLWTKQEWKFALSVITASTGLSPKQIKKRVPKAGDLLRLFNECIRKTGLTMQLQQMVRIPERHLVKQLNKPGSSEWDTEWEDPDV